MAHASRALLDELSRVISRDLAALQREIGAYPDDAAPWAPLGGLTNCGGTLALHVAGNLRHFVGAGLGGTGYVRDREAEFGTRDLSRAELQARVGEAIADVRAALAACDPAVLEQPFPLEVGGRHPGTRLFLLHLAAHLAYHLGQVDAHRRGVTGQSQTVDALSIAELFA